MAELHELGALELVRGGRARELSWRSARGALDRIDALNGHVNAVVECVDRHCSGRPSNLSR